MNENIIEIEAIDTYLGNRWIHKNLSLQVKKGEVLGIVGGSGSGKTTLLRAMLALNLPRKGAIKIFEHDIMTASPKTLLKIQRRWGVLFQQNALFSSLNLVDNIGFPLKEHTDLDLESIREIAQLKIALADLPSDTATLYPAELSGGMQKRAGLARAIALDPELLFLDEPTAGLDPQTAANFDQLIADLQTTMGLTIVMITHDLDSLWKITDRVAFLGKGKVLAVQPIAELFHNKHPMIQAFFAGERGQAAAARYQNKE